ncbi:MAG TPA: hypothetical protein VFK13_08005 [Gemmatimonadaceae bacterium]|nr:hypothetical protein [Gemmatimonadaceae bacterium]
MSGTLVLLLAVAVAYLAARIAFDWLARRFLIVSGAEYLLLGILLGPQVSGVLSAGVLEGFSPLIILALGWIGAIVGTQFYLRGLVRIPGIAYRLAFVEGVATFVFVSGLEWFLLARAFELTSRDAIVPAVGLGAIAVVSAPAGIEVVSRQLGRRVPVVRQLQVTTAIDALVGICALGLLYCVYHATPPAASRVVTPTEWAVITLGIGLVGGMLFHLFLGSERGSDRLFISLAGAVVLISGAAASLHLSPLLAAMVLGATLINTSANRTEIATTLSNAERPFYFVLLVFAGAMWQPRWSGWWIVPVLLFLVARALGKVASARLSSRLNGALAMTGSYWGRALLGQGGLAVALALDYHGFQGGRGDVVFGAAIASVLLTDIASARFVKSVVAPMVREPARGDRRRGRPGLGEGAWEDVDGSDGAAGAGRASGAVAGAGDGAGDGVPGAADGMASPRPGARESER